MSQMEEDYENDERTACKYGASCYQKNEAHREKYKHTPSTTLTAKKNHTPMPPTKKLSSRTTSLKQQKLNFIFQKKERKTEVAKIDTEKKDIGKKEKEEKLKVVKTDVENKNEEKKIEQEETDEEAEEREKTDEQVETDEVKTDTEKEDEEEEKEKSCTNVSEEDSQKIIKKLFLVDMPADFFSFWSFCKSLSPQNPKDALKSLDLTLVGPFDVLAGTLKENSIGSSEALVHWRYYYDPPEFQTILKGSKDSFHLGYFRDDPNLPPVFVAYNEAAKNSLITHVAENIFGAVDWYITQSEKASNPFKKMKTSNVKSSLHEWAKKHNFTLEKYSKKMQERNKSTVCKTFHQAGIVVPYDKKTELGYRPLSETPNNLKKLLKKIETAGTKEERTAHLNTLYTVANWANIALDEGDFGTNLELGLDLFSYGTDHFNSIIRSSLQNAYNQLNRQAFAAIIQAHLENRRKGDDLSVIKDDKV